TSGKALDRVISVAGLSFVALPEFVVGVVVIVVFAVKLGWLPVSSQVPAANPVDIVRQCLLPSIPLMFVLFGYISRMARAGTIEALRSNYTRTAVLKGLPRRHIIVRHVLRNALLPTIAVVSVQVGYLVGGLVVVETLFNYPGIGQLILNAATGHDLPTLEACVLMIVRNPQAVDTAATLAPPSGDHWFGTDDLGRDVFSRVIAGSAPVLTVAPLATLLGLAGGTTLGLITGYYRGWVDDIFSRVVDALLAFPLIIMAVLVLASLGREPRNVVLVVGLTFSPRFA